MWAIAGKEEKVLLGRCVLNLIADTSEAEVDVVLARDYWRKGYATEAAKAALKHGFRILKIGRIIALLQNRKTLRHAK